MDQKRQAHDWWNSMGLEQQFYKTIKNNAYIKGDRTRHPNTLTSHEIILIWHNETQT